MAIASESVEGLVEFFGLLTGAVIALTVWFLVRKRRNAPKD